jgi:hypothetical protein
MKKMILLAATAFVAASSAFGQDRLMQRQKSHQPGEPGEYKRAYFGIGLGLEYGGLGFHAEFLPIKYVSIFAAGGYNFNGIGFNAGATFKALPNCKITPTLIGMYGYNGVIVVQGATQYNKTYYGPTAGIGGELKVGRRDNKLRATILYPFRNEEFDNDYDAMRKNPAINVTQEALPITYSIGFSFSL